MTDTTTTRRMVLRRALAGAAAAATTGSFLQAAAAQNGEAKLPLKGGGSLVAREKNGRWTATVISRAGEKMPSATGTVVLENDQTLSLKNGQVIDGGAKFGGFSLFIDFSAPAPAVVRQPVLSHQSEMLKSRPALAPQLELKQDLRVPKKTPDLQVPKIQSFE